MNFREETRHGAGHWGHLISSPTLSPFPSPLPDPLPEQGGTRLPKTRKADSGWELMSELMDQQLDWTQITENSKILQEGPS